MSLSTLKKIIIIFAFLVFVQSTSSMAVVRVSNMNDFITLWSGIGNIVLTDNICVYDNTSITRSRLRGIGSGAGSAFTVASGTSTISYQVRYQGSLTPYSVLVPNVYQNFSTPNSTSTTCSGGTNGTLEITFLESDMLAADAGTYTGVLTIMVRT